MDIKKIPRELREGKLRRLAEDWGFGNVNEFLSSTQCFTTGICVNADCDGSTDDCESGTDGDWCETCEANTVVSGIELDVGNASD